MSQKHIKPHTSSVLSSLGQAPVPTELRDIAGDLILEKDRGGQNYEAALACLLARFRNSDYCNPDFLTGKAGKPPEAALVESVRLTINYFGEVFPPSPENRPLGVPELALIMGAVIGTVAASAYERKKADLETIEAQFEIAWISMREWLPRGIMMLRRARKEGLIGEDDE